MKCPNDDAVLVMTSREGIEIDYCPDCRGIWLDRGELDKLIERSDTAYAGAATRTSAPVPGQEYFDNREDTKPRFSGPNHRDPGPVHDNHRSEHKKYYGGHYNDHHGKKHRKESFLGDLFDF